MRISDWSSDVCSSDLEVARDAEAGQSTGQEIEEGLTADFDTFELRLTHVARTVDIISDAVDEFERRGADNAIGDVAIIARHGHETALPIIFERRVEALGLLRAQVGIARRSRILDIRIGRHDVAQTRVE